MKEQSLKYSLEQKSDKNLAPWLELWGRWLDDLISSGVANISPEVRQLVINWSDMADLLGFAPQADMSRKFLSTDIDTAQKTDLFYQLMVHYDLLQRLFYAEGLKANYSYIAKQHENAGLHR